MMFALISLTSNGQQAIDSLRKISSIESIDNGIIEWTSSGETTKEPYIIEQYRWNKWMRIGEVDPHLGLEQNTYQFKALPHYGENKCRVRPTNNSLYPKEVKWINTEAPKIIYSYDKQKAQIIFLNELSKPTETIFEIIDSSGKIVKKGRYSTVTVNDLPKGKYTLHYDNSITKFKR